MRLLPANSPATLAICCLAALLVLTVSRGATPTPPGATFNVRHYGAKADGTTDDSAAFKTAVQAALKAGPGNVVTIPAGKYFLAEGWNRDALIDLSGAKGLTIRGEAGTLLLKGDHAKRFFLLKDCRDVTISRLKLDEATLDFTQGIITACDANAHTCTVRIDAGYDAPDRVDLALHAGTFRVFTDDRSNSWDQEDIPFIEKREPLPDGQWLFTLDRNGRTDFTGKKVLLWANSGGGWAFDLIGCPGSVLLEDIAWYGGGYGNCFATNDCDGDVTVRRLYIGPPPGTNRLIAGQGSHQGSSRGRLTLEDCDLSRFDDDGVNTLSTFAHVLAQTGPNVLVVQHGRWRVGDRVSLWDWTYQQQHARDEATVRTVTRKDNDTFELNLDKAVQTARLGPEPEGRPESERDGIDRLCCLPQVGTLVIRHCRVSCSRARALLVKSHDALIEDSTIYDSHYGLQAGTETYWSEGPQLLNLTVRHCTFENVDAPGLDIGIFDSRASRDCRNILVENCVFRANGQRRNRYPQGVGLRLRNVDGAVVRGNRFEDNPGANLIIQDARNVRVENNVFVHPNGRKIDSKDMDGGAVVWLDHADHVQLSGNVVQRPGPAMRTLVSATDSVTDATGLKDGVRLEK